MRSLAIVLTLAWAAFARADAVSDAKEHYRQGQSLIQRRQYHDAHREFVAGFELSRKAAFVFNAAECSRLAGDSGTARVEYTQYLELDPMGKQATLARARLAELGPDPTRPEEPAPVEPAPDPAPAPAPAVSQVVIAPPAVAAAQIVRHQSAAPFAATVEKPSTSIWHRKVVWIGLATAVVAGTATIYLLSQHDNTCSPPGCVVAR